MSLAAGRGRIAFREGNCKALLRGGYEMLAGEQVLVEAENGALTLTTQRIRVRSQHFGTAYFGSVMLDQVASCEVARRSYPVFLVIAACAVLFGILVGFWTREPGTGISIGVLVAVGCLLAYLLTRRMTLAFASAGATLHIDFRMSLASAIEFIDAVEAARADYVKGAGYGT